MRRGNHKEVIRATAARMFREKGYSHTSLREIASCVGVSKPALYYFFASKDELLLAVIRATTEASNENMARIVNSDLDPREKLQQAVLVMARSYDSHPNENAVYVSNENIDLIAPHVREYITTNKRHFAGMVERIIAEGRAQGVFRRDLHLRAATFGAIEMVRGMTTWYAQGRGLTAEEVGEVYAKMLLSAFTPDENSLTPRAQPASNHS